MKLPDVMFGSDLIELDTVIYIYSQCLFLNKNNKRYTFITFIKKVKISQNMNNLHTLYQGLHQLL